MAEWRNLLMLHQTIHLVFHEELIVIENVISCLLNKLYKNICKESTGKKQLLFNSNILNLIYG